MIPEIANRTKMGQRVATVPTLAVLSSTANALKTTGIVTTTAGAKAAAIASSMRSRDIW